MLINRKSDYAIRVCRVLKDNKLHSAKEICQVEDIPKAFAYKIIRELEMKEIIESERGKNGGYKLAKDLNDLTLYDLIGAIDEDIYITHCMNEACGRNTADAPCLVHKELCRVQALVKEELSSKSIAEILK